MNISVHVLPNVSLIWQFQKSCT